MYMTLHTDKLEWVSLEEMLHELYEIRLQRGLVTAAALGARTNEMVLGVSFK